MYIQLSDVHVTHAFRGCKLRGLHGGTPPRYVLHRARCAAALGTTLPWQAGNETGKIVLTKIPALLKSSNQVPNIAAFFGINRKYYD
jgi:hypothetical protein